MEKRAIIQALEVSGGDRMRAAKRLGIGKTTLYRKLKQYGLNDKAGIRLNRVAGCGQAADYEKMRARC